MNMFTIKNQLIYIYCPITAHKFNRPFSHKDRTPSCKLYVLLSFSFSKWLITWKCWPPFWLHGIAPTCYGGVQFEHFVVPTLLFYMCKRNKKAINRYACTKQMVNLSKNVHSRFTAKPARSCSFCQVGPFIVPMTWLITIIWASYV